MQRVGQRHGRRCAVLGRRTDVEHGRGGAEAGELDGVAALAQRDNRLDGRAAVEDGARKNRVVLDGERGDAAAAERGGVDAPVLAGGRRVDRERAVREAVERDEARVGRELLDANVGGVVRGERAARRVEVEAEQQQHELAVDVAGGARAEPAAGQRARRKPEQRADEAGVDAAKLVAVDRADVGE